MAGLNFQTQTIINSNLDPDSGKDVKLFKAADGVLRIKRDFDFYKNKDGYGNIELLASLIFYGLIMGEKLRANFTANEELPFDVFDCYDWIDEVGGITSDEVQRIQDLYVKHNEMSVPKSDKKKVVEMKIVK